MKVDFCDNTGSMCIEAQGMNGNRTDFSISVSLYNEKTDTEIRFETESSIDIGEWQHKREIISSQNNWELENISVQAKHNISDAVYQEFFLYEYFIEMRSNINSGHLTFTMKSEMSFENMLDEEISNVLQFQPESTESSSCIKEGLMHISLRKTWDADILCGRLLKVDSRTLHIVRDYATTINSANEPERIHEFNSGCIDEIIIGGFEGEEIKFKRIDGKVIAIGSIWDSTFYPQNSIEFEGPAEIIWLDE